jgi:hypothetical protein
LPAAVRAAHVLRLARRSSKEGIVVAEYTDTLDVYKVVSNVVRSLTQDERFHCDFHRARGEDGRAQKTRGRSQVLCKADHLRIESDAGTAHTRLAHARSFASACATASADTPTFITAAVSCVSDTPPFLGPVADLIILVDIHPARSPEPRFFALTELDYILEDQIVAIANATVDDRADTESIWID